MNTRMNGEEKRKCDSKKDKEQQEQLQKQKMRATILACSSDLFPLLAE